MALVVAALLAPASDAGEPNKRGKYAIVHWLDESGAPREVRGGEIRYGYWVRTQYNVPRDGKMFADRLELDKGIPLAKNFVKFTSVDVIELIWAGEGTEASKQLELRFTEPKGKVTTGSGNTLAGVNHASPPFIQYMVDGKEHRIEIPPLATAAQRQGKPLLQKLVFVLHH